MSENPQRDKILRDPTDIDEDDRNVWPDGRGVRRAIYDARRHHTTAMNHLDLAQTQLGAPRTTRPPKPRRLIKKPSARDVLEHSMRVSDRAERAMSDVDKLWVTVMALLGAFLAHHNAMDEITKALAQSEGEDPKILQQAVYEQTAQVEALRMPTIKAVAEALEAGATFEATGVLRDFEEQLRQIVAKAEDADELSVPGHS